SAVAAVASGPITFVANPAQATALLLRSFGAVRNVVLPTIALPVGTIIAVADTALAASIEGPPLVDASRQAEFHADDSPGQIATSGTMVTPVGSVFQTDSVALRMRWPVSWVLRGPALAWMQSVNW